MNLVKGCQKVSKTFFWWQKGLKASVKIPSAGCSKKIVPFVLKKLLEDCAGCSKKIALKTSKDYSWENILRFFYEL